MVERERKENSKESYKKLGVSLGELESKAYRYRVQEGANNASELGRVMALKIIREQDDQIVSFTVFNSWLDKNSRRLISKLIDRRIRKLSTRSDRIPHIEGLALKTLKAAGLHTIAAMEIRQNKLTGKGIVAIRYPMVFMNLDPSIAPSRKDEAGAAIAAYFLKLVPSKKNLVSRDVKCLLK